MKVSEDKIDTSKLKNLWPPKTHIELLDHIENHLEVFGYCTITYQLCEDLCVFPEELINSHTHEIERGVLSFVIRPISRFNNSGVELAKFSAAELKQSIKDRKRDSRRKQKALN